MGASAAARPVVHIEIQNAPAFVDPVELQAKSVDRLILTGGNSHLDQAIVLQRGDRGFFEGKRGVGQRVEGFHAGRPRCKIGVS